MAKKRKQPKAPRSPQKPKSGLKPGSTPKSRSGAGSGARSAQRSGRIPWAVLLVPLFIVVGGVALLGYLAWDVDRLGSRMNLEADQWAVDYWRTPIPAQGPAPANYIPQAASLQPEDCGICHPAQFADWKQSLHSETMGPGVVGQYPSMHAGEISQCNACHAPMLEQYAEIAGSDEYRPNRLYDSDLAAKGLVCSACHLRKHQRHGPPLRPGKESASHLAHGDPQRTTFFQSSEFCKGCHQHPTTSLKINGKTVENTYQEWLDSPYAAKGITCQQCHMPDRRHLWRGIHDKEMTLSGVTIESSVSPAAPAVGDGIEAVLTLFNTGTGHAFPTYTTPAVFLRAAFKDAEGQFLRGEDGRIAYYEEHIIQRRLDMSTNPWREEFDTRVLPGDSAQLVFRQTVPPQVRFLDLWVWVDPDHFYNGFFRSRLRNGAEFPGADDLRTALQVTVDRRYLLWSRTIPVAPAAP